MSVALAARAAALLGAEVVAAAPLTGGDLAQVMRLGLADGRSVVAKAGAGVAAEAGMLRAIAAAGAPAPAVLAVGDGLMVMQDLGPDEGLSGGAWEDLGRVLRRLHGAARADGAAPGHGGHDGGGADGGGADGGGAAGGGAGGSGPDGGAVARGTADGGGAAHGTADGAGAVYGWAVDHAFGPVAIPNGWAEDWPAFWAARRLLPCCPHIPADLARRVEALCARLPDLIPARPAPALLHGDLWAGNVLARGGRVTGLIDPACYHGHGEVDLAMLALFGRPAPAFHAAYGPEPGHDARRPLYQLWPALVHLRLFGAGYRGLMERCLRAVE